MMDESFTTMHEIEQMASQVFHRVKPLLDPASKVSLEDMCYLTKITKNCSSMLKNVAKFHEHSLKMPNSSVIL